MANQNLKVSLIIDVDAKSGRASLRGVTGGLEQVERQSGRTGRAMGSLAQRFNQVSLSAFGFNEISNALSQIGQKAEALVRLSDGWGDLNARIKIGTGSQEAANQSMERLADIATDAHVALGAVGDLYSGLVLKVKRPKEELLDFTQAVTDSIRVAGTPAITAAGSINQLGQALGFGALRGEEFNSVGEGMPLVLQAIEKQTGKTRAQLRQMAEDNKLTTDLVIASVLAMRDEWRGLADEMPLTIGRAVTDLTTRLQQYLGTSEDVRTANKNISFLIAQLTNNLEALIPVVGTVARIGGDLLLVFIGARMIKAISNVGKLTGSVKSLGKALIPLFTVDKVLSLIGEIATAERTITDLEQRRATAAKTAADAVDANFAYRNIRLRTEAELAAMTTAEQRRYATGLASANAYYQGLATQARQAGSTLRALSPIEALFDADGFSGGEDLTAPVTEQALVYAKRMREIRAAISSAEKAAGQRATAEAQFATRIGAAMAQQKLAIKDAMQSAIADYRAARSAAARAAADHKSLVTEYRTFARELSKPVKTQDFSFTAAAVDLLDLKKLLRDGLFDEALAGAEDLKEKLATMAETAVGNDRGILGSIARDLADLVDEAGKQKELIAQQDVDTAKARIQEVSDQAAALGFIHIGFDADASTDDLRNRIEALSKELAKALVIPVTFKSGGGVRTPEIPGFSTGGPIPGYGGGDSLVAALEPGEFVVRKEAAATYGDLLHSINNLQVPQFADGGSVGGSAGTSQPDASLAPVNLTIGGRTFRVSTARDQVNGLADAVRRVNRGNV